MINRDKNNIIDPEVSRARDGFNRYNPAAAARAARRVACLRTDSEKAVEHRLAAECRRRGLPCLKYSSPCAAGYPDRLVLLPGGRVAWAELKSRGCRLRPLQQLRKAELQQMGHTVAVIDSTDGVGRFLDTLLP